MGSIFFLWYYLRSLTCYRRRAPASMFVWFRGKQEVSSSTLCSGCGYWIRLIFTNILTLLQGASSSSPGVARRGSSHQDSLPPLENDFPLDWSAERKACDSHTPGDKGSSLFRRRLAAAPKRRAWSFSFVEKRGWPEVYGSPRNRWRLK
jgi:hypothetical protein